MDNASQIRVCFVCLGNICRSPTAEGIFISLVHKHGLASHYQIDSAGTGGWHVGAAPDPRSHEEARRRGIDLPSRARQFRYEDLMAFDHIIAMDRKNLRDLRRLSQDDGLLDKIRLLRDYDPTNTAAKALDVPDPYYGGANGFVDVFDLCMRSCEQLLATLESTRRRAPSA